MLSLLRYKYDPKNDVVLGILLDGNGGTYHTLERMSKALPTNTSISVKVNYSPRFGRDLPLLTCDGFGPERGYRIHTGNSVKDSSGCILVGNTSFLNDRRLGLSNEAFNQLMNNLNHEDTLLFIRNV